MPETAIVQPYEIGKFYLVPVINLKEVISYYPLASFGGQIPVIGEAHEDFELINDSKNHYHIDWRFVDNKQFKAISEPATTANLEFGRVVWEHDIESISTRRLKCKRDFRQWPTHVAGWFPKLQEKYAHTVAKNGRCPHRGYDMTTLKPDENGCVTCPLHGLKWNAQSWKMELQGINV